MKRVAVIGGGVSGLSVAQLLRETCDVQVFEREASPGGLIRCETVGGSLFHLCGGHVFNTKNENVERWFWAQFDRDRDFIKAERHSAVCMDDGQFVGYPIENHVYQLDEPIRERVYADWKKLSEAKAARAKSFGELLRNGFGETLYGLYFRPYNGKIWGCDIENVPASWLSGKFPMPTPQQMLEANKRHLQENEFVHSSFFYPRCGGSQFIADTLAKGLSIEYGCDIGRISVLKDGGVLVNGGRFDKVFFCGNVKELPGILEGVDIGAFSSEIEALPYHGTTAVFCETDPIPYSWFYQPTPRHKSHRFICTGNFSPSNNADGKMTCTVEFTDELSEDEIVRQLALMPFSPQYLCHHYSRYSYPIQRAQTRQMIGSLKEMLAPYGVHLVGRFAEWEYYNMDVAMAAVMEEIERAGVRRL